MNLEKVKKLNIPKKPGCYLYRNKKSEIIYVGKAIDLRSRVLSYWRESSGLTPAKIEMLKQVEKIDWVEVDSEIEAMLLEANLIKKHQPYFNVLMRDDKRYIYIKVSTEEKWPRVFMTRDVGKAGRYFGPFTSTEAVRETLRVLRKIWPYRSCKNLPQKVCLYYRIGKCPGVCEELMSQNDYRKIIRQIVLFLEGRKKQVVSEIEGEIMKSKIKNQKSKVGSIEYEELERKIGYLKYQLINLKNVLEHTRILSLGDKFASDVVELAKVFGLPKIPKRIEGYDISNIFGQEAVGSMVVFADGEPDKNQYRKFKIKSAFTGGDIAMLKEVLERRFEHLPLSLSSARRGHAWPAPDLIIIDGGKAQRNVAIKILKDFKIDIPVLAISKGDGLRSAKAPDKIFFPGEKQALELPLASPALHVIKRVRDEAHRFAIDYHRDLRGRRFRPQTTDNRRQL